MCLSNLDTVLKRCVETNLVLNWEKCNFMVTEGIVLGHNVKVGVIENFPHQPMSKEFEAFLAMQDFTEDLSRTSQKL